MEGARNPIGKPDLDALLRLYHADKETAVALEEMRREGKQRGWWSTYKLPAWLGDLVGLEADAVTERVVELELSPLRCKRRNTPAPSMLPLLTCLRVPRWSGG
jgi:hypothetical protein